MIKPGYQNLKSIFENADKTIYIGNSVTANENILLKVVSLSSRKGAIISLKSEAEFLKSYANPGIPEIIDYDIEKDNYLLSLKSFDGILLKSFLLNNRLTVGDGLDIAIKICNAVSVLHDLSLVNCNLNSLNILIDSDRKQIQLIDYGFVTAVNELRTGIKQVSNIQGDPRYISPEQTGRINRTVDFRTDLYSLGVIFYELFTGKLPFSSEDPIDLIYSHIAAEPLSPSILYESVPETLSKIILKLLAKDPEERYQSCNGLISDLGNCLNQYNNSGSIPEFEIATKDFSKQFYLRQKLYGREKEIEILLSAHKRICNESCEILIVSGYSGIGKTSLINQILKPVVQNNGNFINGKFDQVNRQQPYGAVSEAFGLLTRLLLSEPERKLKYWKGALSNALGNNGAVLTEVIPELEYVIGKQPDVPELPPTENQNRFNLYFQKFVNVFAHKNHPLVLFLDDLQWADQASLNLISKLLNSSMKGFLLIGAYRDNEVDNFHPLTLMLDEIKNAGVKISEINLKPLEQIDVDLLISESFKPRKKSTARLSEVVYKKTEGNPFFTKEFLQSLYEEDILTFSGSGPFDKDIGWDWDLEKVLLTHETDNVISLMIRKINKLEQPVRELLKVASCLGNTFSLKSLVLTNQLRDESTYKLLSSAIDRGLVLAGGKDIQQNQYSSPEFKFIHDRVQQACYSLISPSEKKNFHLRIGNSLLANIKEEERESLLFGIVNHLNIGSELLTDENEIINIVKLNLEAGKKAKTSSAYTTAQEYFNAGYKHLNGKLWDTNYRICFELVKELGEAEYLCSNFEDSNKYFELALDKSRSILDKAEIYILKIVQYENMANYNDAVQIGKTALMLFGIDLPDEESAKKLMLNDEIHEVDQKLKTLRIEDLINLPEIKDAEIRLCVKLLMTIWAPAYISGDAFLPPLLAAKMVRLSIEHGNCFESAYGYVVYGIMIGSLLGNYKTGYEFGKLGLEVNELFKDKKYRTKIRHMFSCFINFWRLPLRTCFEYSSDAFKNGIETGDFVYSTYASFHESWYGFLTSKSLESFNKDYISNLSFLSQIKNYSFADAQKIILNWGLAMQGKTKSPSELTDQEFDEITYEKKYFGIPFFLTFFYITKSYLAFQFDELEKAESYAIKAEEVVPALIGTIWDALLCFYYSLTITAKLSVAKKVDEESLNKVDELLNKMKRWADNSPDNFNQFYFLMAAEKAKLANNYKQAYQLYENSIKAASGTGFIQIEALAWEKAAELWLLKNNVEKSTHYLAKSIFLYMKWGALAKVNYLEQKYLYIFKLSKLAFNQTIHQTPVKADPEIMQRTEKNQIKQDSINIKDIDLVSIIKAAQAISKEMVPVEVSKKLMHIAMINAGAQKGILILRHHDTYSVETSCRLKNNVIEELDCSEEESKLLLSSSLINYINRTNQHIIISDVSKDERFKNEKYFQLFNPKSVLCMPINYQGEIKGILYLENKHTTDSFSNDRIEVLQLLSSQAAISLTNARLYYEIKNEVAERQRTEKILRSITESTASLTGADFFQTLVKKLTTALDVRYAIVTECTDTSKTRLRTLAYAEENKIIRNVEYDVDGTPCQIVMSGREYYTLKDLEKFFPKEEGISGYLGVPIYDHSGETIGHIAVFDSIPFHKGEKELDILRIFAARAGAEIERKIALEKLQLAHSVLENRINERTIELSNTNKALEEEITERKKIESNLEKARDAAEMANKAKSEFLANMSHELRTPLNAILGYTQILKRDKTLRESDKKAVDIIHRSGEHLLTLINDVLDLAKIEAQKLEIKESEFELPEFLNHIADMIRIRTEQKGLFCNFEVSGTLPLIIKSDEKRLRQILINLLSNAVKFTDNGGISFSVFSEMFSNSKTKLTFEIKDTGIGIVRENLEEIFKPFLQVSDKTRMVEGAGLGLAITKNLVTLMGGNVNVSSVYGKGSTFTVQLIVKCNESAALSEQFLISEITGYEGDRKTILIVDDKNENRSFLVNLLNPLGFDVIEAENGMAAVEIALRSKPDLILMDLVMPVLDGFEATRRLKENPVTEDIKIIALSASVFEYNQQKSRDAGCNDFIPKPVQAENLLESLKNCLNIKWIYSVINEEAIKSKHPADFTNDLQKLNPAVIEGLKSIYEFASMGDVQGINNLLNSLNHDDKSLNNFKEEINKHLKEFDMQKIKILIKPLLEKVQ